jgi:hypothetical protein
VARPLNLRFSRYAADLVIVLARAAGSLPLGASNNLLSRSAVGSSCAIFGVLISLFWDGYAAALCSTVAES